MAVPSTGARSAGLYSGFQVDPAVSSRRSIDHFAFEECGCANPLPLWQILRQPLAISLFGF